MLFKVHIHMSVSVGCVYVFSCSYNQKKGNRMEIWQLSLQKYRSSNKRFLLKKLKQLSMWSSSSYGRVSMIQIRHNKRIGTEGLSFLLPQPAVQPRSNAGSNRVEPAPCFVIQNCQTHYSSRCPMCGTG